MTAAAHQPHRWSRAEFERLVACGGLSPARSELVDGEILDTAPRQSIDSTGVRLVAEALRAACGAGFDVRNRFTYLPTMPEPSIPYAPGDDTMQVLPLADVLAQLRAQLAEAEQKAAGQELRLTVKEIDVELTVTVKADGQGKVSFNVWAAEGELGGGAGRETGHTIRLKLDPGLQQADGIRRPLDVVDEDDLGKQ